MKLYQLKEILLEDLEVPEPQAVEICRSVRTELKYLPRGKYKYTIDGKLIIIEKEKE